MNEYEIDDALYGDDADQVAAEQAFFDWVETQPERPAEPAEVHAHLDGMIDHLGMLQRVMERRSAVALAHVRAAEARANRYTERGDLQGRIERLFAQIATVSGAVVAGTKSKSITVASGTVKTRTVDTWRWDDDDVLLKELLEAGHFELIRPESVKVVPASVDKVALKKAATVVFTDGTGAAVLDGEILPMVTVEKTTSVDIAYAADAARRVDPTLRTRDEQCLVMDADRAEAL